MIYRDIEVITTPAFQRESTSIGVGLASTPHE